MSEQNSLVKYDLKDRIVTLTLNRPEKLNAFNDDMMRELVLAMRRFDTDEEADLAIIVGSGRAFSSGADVVQRQLRSREELAKQGGPPARDARGSDLFTQSVNWKPVIAAVHGYAVGMGMGIALACDLTVAETGARFQVTETPRGLSGARYWALLNFRGHSSFATEVTLTGRFFTAEEAHAAGVIDRVAPPGGHLEAALELARSIVCHPPLGVRVSVRTRRWEMEDAEREAIRQSSMAKLYLTEDFAEAARAFAEKRKAGPFKGR